jgi:cellulose synthase/poly-beta-1,6-N-acetylglucosamine synthase-like glycosyltransferase
LTKEIFQLFAIHGVALGFGLLSPFVFSMVITYLHFGCFLAYFAIGYKKPEKKMPKLIIKNVMYLFNLFLICAGASEV